MRVRSGWRSTGSGLAELVYLSLGSNIDPERHLPLALERLGEIGRLAGVSRAYQNPPVGAEGQPDYLNAVAALEFEGNRAELREAVRAIEADLGRVRADDKFAARTIDIDVLWWGDTDDYARAEADPELSRLAHLAIPLSELAPALRLPDSGRRLSSVAQQLAAAAELIERPEVGAELQRRLEGAAEKP